MSLALNVGASNGAQSLARLSGVSHFVVDQTDTRVRGSFNATVSNWNTECRTSASAGSACGSVRVNGTFSQVVFDVQMLGGGGAGDLFEFIWTFNQDLGDAPSSVPRALHAIPANITRYLGLVPPDDDSGGNEFSIDADRDDTQGVDDEDGAVFPSFQPGETTPVTIRVAEPVVGSSALQFWVDWNDDGVFGAGEKVASNAVNNGSGDLDSDPATITLNVPVPSNAPPGFTIARLRWSSQSGLGVATNAPDGEVEDYRVSIAFPSGGGDSCLPLPVIPVAGTNAVILPTNEVRLTEAVNSQLGAAWGANRLDLTQPFDYQAKVFLGSKDGNGADGMTFTIQDEGTSAVGPVGRGMGAGDAEGGLSGISPSLIVELDTYRNGDAGWSDPVQDHLAVYLNGNGRHNGASTDLAGPVLFSNIEDGVLHDFRITWEPVSQTLEVYFDGAKHVSINHDLITSLGTSSPLWGYTASTGGFNNEHRICNQTDPASANILDYSDAPASYGDATHNVVVGTRLGPDIDTDPGSLASAQADGDGADDDGVVIPALQQAQRADIDVSVFGDGGYLSAWIDYNGNGTFEDNEQIAADLQDNGAGDLDPATGQITVPVSVPPSATTDPSFARFRWSTQTGLSATGAAIDGEVEDYTLIIAPGTVGVPNSCLLPIVGAANGNSFNWPGTQSVVSVTTNLNWSATADSDTLRLVQGQERPLGGSDHRWDKVQDMSLTLNFSNPVPASEMLMRFNDVGASQNTVFDPVFNFNVTGTATPANFVLTPAGGGAFSDPHLIYSPATAQIRKVVPLGNVRESGVLVGQGSETVSQMTLTASNFGSVSDFIAYNLGYIGECDFGDAPDAGPGTGADDYETLAASDGPGHVLRPFPQFYLGAGVTGESDGQPSLAADLDQDEGVLIPNLPLGQTVNITANVQGSGGYLQGWIDWNLDGDFDDVGEAVAQDLQDAGGVGSINIPVTVPANVPGTSTIARFRWSPVSGIGPGNFVIHGEVEDYRVAILSQTRLSGSVINDNGVGGGNAHDGVRNGAEKGLADVPVRLLHDADNSGTCEDGEPEIALTTTDGNGDWFLDLPASESGKDACLVVQTLNGFRSVSENSGGNPVVAGDVDDDLMVLTVPAAGSVWQGLLFGDVGLPILRPDQQGDVAPGNSIIYPHRFTSATAGTVDFSLVSPQSSPATPAWGQQVFIDAGCDGELNAGDGGLAVTGINVSPDETLCLLVKVFAPEDAPLGAQHSVTVRASQMLSGTLFEEQTEVEDLTRVQLGQLALVKAVRNIGPDGIADTGDDVDVAFGDSNEASPCDVLRYRLTFRNSGVRPLDEVRVHDATPAFTQLAAPLGCPSGLPDALTGCTPQTSDGPNAVGYEGGVEWVFSGRLAPGGEGQVSYDVRLSGPRPGVNAQCQ
ncbi:MAG: GEVED domain-containing protein [Alcanivorax sp.]|uniref:GEVED domain-containing protein n=1 Tax=Alcanivorax sp. TaxID=1872427 RepID=UPI003DA6EE14